MGAITLQDLRVVLDDHVVLDGLDLHVEDGGALALLGASGAGKSTLLRSIAGHVDVTGGRVLLDGVDVTGLPARERGLGMVAQGAPMQNTRTVEDNLAMPLVFNGVRDREARSRAVRSEARSFGLLDVLRSRPSRLSEGERHSAATARAAVRDRVALLLDEPVVHLDPEQRKRVLTQLLALRRSRGTTLLVASNDPAIARAMADRFAVLAGGRIVQDGPHAELASAPRTLEVLDLVSDEPPARLVGRIDTGPAGSPARVMTAAGDLAAWAPAVRDHRGAVQVAIRPGDVRLVPPGTGDLAGRVLRVATLGADRLVTVGTAAGTIAVRTPQTPPRPDEAVDLAVQRAVVADQQGAVLAAVGRER